MSKLITFYSAYAQVAAVLTKKEAVAHAAEIEHRAVPPSVLLQEGLMIPQQRRERLQFETNYHHARRAMQKAENDDRRLHQIIHDMSLKNQHKYRDFTSKSNQMNPRLNHHDRIFNVTPVEWNPQWAQYLRNQFDGGRSYDVVNGGAISCCPPTIAEKNHPRQTHSSVIAHPHTR